MSGLYLDLYLDLPVIVGVSFQPGEALLAGGSSNRILRICGAGVCSMELATM